MKSIPFITYSFDTLHQRNMFRMTEEAAAFLSQLRHQQIAVLSIVGKYRTGKSYLLNQLISDGEDPGFQVGPTINPCTKGIWLWTNIIESQNSHHPRQKIIVLDSEGFGSFEQDALNKDMRLYIFVLLISSCLLYNQIGPIDEYSLNDMSLLLNCVKEVKKSSDQKLWDEAAAAKQDASDFPRLVWILRDFSLQVINKNGEAVSDNQYLENCLDEQPGSGGEKGREKNRIRAAIKQCFRSRECATFVIPCENESDLQQIGRASDQQQQQQLRPKFKEQISRLRTAIFSSIAPRSFAGKCADGQILLSVCQSYIETLNGGFSINMQAVWRQACEDQCS